MDPLPLLTRMGKADGFPGALAGVAIASPCILFFWLLRRSYYMNLAPARAAIGAFIYFVLTTGGLFVVYQEGADVPVFGVPADGDRCARYGTVSFVADKESATCLTPVTRRPPRRHGASIGNTGGGHWASPS